MSTSSQDLYPPAGLSPATVYVFQAGDRERTGCRRIEVEQWQQDPAGDGWPDVSFVPRGKTDQEVLTLRRGQLCLVLEGEGHPGFEALLRHYIETRGIKVLAEIGSSNTSNHTGCCNPRQIINHGPARDTGSANTKGKS